MENHQNISIVLYDITFGRKISVILLNDGILKSFVYGTFIFEGRDEFIKSLLVSIILSLFELNFI